MNNFGRMALVSVALVWFPSLVQAQPGPAQEVPELQVLSHWIGTWDIDMTVKVGADAAKVSRTKGKATAKWILDGRFVQQTGTLEAGDGMGMPAMKVTTLMTYDQAKKAYRSWMFYSTGTVSESEGSWAAKTRTMTTTSRDADNNWNTTIKATFPDPATEVWQILVKDGAGKVIVEVNGKNTRRKK